MTIEVNENQFAALVRGDAVSVGPSKRVVTLADGPFVVNSYPAPHCGREGERGGSAPRSECSAGYDRDSANDIFQHIPKTKRWDAVRDSLSAIDSVHGIDIWEALPLQETRAEKKGGSYHIAGGKPKRMMIKFEDGYGESTEMSIVHETGHHIDHWLLGQSEPYGMLWFSEAVAEQYGKEGKISISVTGLQDMIDRLSSYSVQDDKMTLGVDELHFALEPSDEISEAGIYLWDAIANSPSYQKMMKFKSGHREVVVPDDYFMGERDNPTWSASEARIKNPVILDLPYGVTTVLKRPREVFTRAYTQYIAHRSGNENLTRAINETVDFTNAGGAPTQWEWDEFEPIAGAFDELFRRKGWLKE